MRKIHECAEDIKNILNDAERTEEVDGDMLCSINELACCPYCKCELDWDRVISSSDRAFRKLFG